MPKSTIRLSVDVSDPVQHRKAERLFSACFQLRRAVQSDARSRVDAYWAAHHERSVDKAAPKRVRERLGLTKKGLEAAAKAHLDAAPHMLHWTSKALGLHLADTVWHPTSRHLFADASGTRFGRPQITGWWDFRRIPGRARSRTASGNKWETFRLHGSLDATREAMSPHAWRHHKPVPTPTVPDAATAWWAYDGPLMVVMAGVGGSDLVLPVRLPTAASNRSHLDHYLGRPELWHQIDLVRYRDPNIDGGWAYEAHLLCLTKPYTSPSTIARRAASAVATAGRRAGGDVNVSNITIASHTDGIDLAVTTIVRTADEKRREQARRVTERRRQKALDRSRRTTNSDQYQPSARQDAAAKRRADVGLPARQQSPAGPRKSRADGKPQRAYRKDALSAGYRHGRGHAAKDGRAAAIARRDTARRIAGELTAVHGTDLTIEHGSITAWAHTWGKAVHAFTPGLLVAAIQTEITAIDPDRTVKRAGTRTTAMSQHCLCRHRHRKPLSERTHNCQVCGLEGGRDAISAVLASCVTMTDSADPATATVDYTLTNRLLADQATRHTLSQTSGVQERPTASTDTPNPTPGVGEGTRPPAIKAGSAPRTGTVPTTTPNEPPSGDHVGTRPTTNPNAPPVDRIPAATGLRDIS
ncbi:hypothetical protein BH23ACT9_BH23ACT9_22990 [soil metagenome]